MSRKTLTKLLVGVITTVMISSGCAASSAVVVPTKPQRPTAWIERGQVAPWAGYLVDDERMRIIGAALGACQRTQ